MGCLAECVGHVVCRLWTSLGTSRMDKLKRENKEYQTFSIDRCRIETQQTDSKDTWGKFSIPTVLFNVVNMVLDGTCPRSTWYLGEIGDEFHKKKPGQNSSLRISSYMWVLVQMESLLLVTRRKNVRPQARSFQQKFRVRSNSFPGRLSSLIEIHNPDVLAW